ncbi:amino acid adenylation domain-containing protein [Rhodobacterales bacterium HKCCE3408]|nr:amino acid adenylation domain-containing protein [Rhodobacterales bacterium HKCCE3408]
MTKSEDRVPSYLRMVEDPVQPSSGSLSDPGAKGPQTVTEVFSEIAATYRDRAALRFDNLLMDYAQLDRRSDALAGRLAELGIGPGDFVGITSGRSQSLIVAVLAVLKAGAAYVPLDLALPRERLNFIASDTGLRVLLGRAPDQGFDGVDVLSPEDFPEEGTAPDVEITGETVAYVMYTSGTTGTPKGVVVPHRSIIRLLRDITWADFGPETSMLHASAFAFDASILDIFAPLLNGGTIVIPPDGMLSVSELADALDGGAANTVWLTSGLFNVVADTRPDCFRHARLVMVGGDVVSPAHLRKVRGICPDVSFLNGYGPTETGVFSTTHPISDAELASDSAIPIGHAVDGTQIYIVDDKLMPVPEGSEGELCVAGRGLAQGYLNRPDQTAEKFVPAPWNADILLYRTGDMGVADADGVIRFLGRLDAQVKVRGYRVELGEVEAAIAAGTGVRQAAVIAVSGSDTADKRLIGFYVAGDDFDETDLTHALVARLPDHARPSELYRVDEIPINANGKTDRHELKSIRDERLAARARRRSAGTGEIGDLIAARFAAALDQPADTLDRRANFFDLGASSLHVARVHEELQKALSRRFPISDFFLHSTIDSLSKHLGGVEVAKTDKGGEPRRRGGGETATDAIAIVGLAGRFPGAPDVDTFWQGLLDGREMISQFTEDELDIDPRAENPGVNYVLARGVMPDPDMFDAKHFGIPPREADRLDPQHRIMLEVAQTALDAAGHDPDRFGGRIGIFCGASQSSYLLNNLVSAPGASRALAAGYPVRDFATALGNDKDFLATRIAYKLNLRGPAVTVQSACSTSLVAVGQACEALRTGQADMCLAGGVSITFPSRRPYAYLPDGMASADGHCRTFDAEATGTVFGDGAGLVVLRRLSDALEDGDEIIAVIRGHAINNDGSDKAGYAAPSIRAQAEVISAAHRAAGVTPRQVGYIEAHGTATPLGDPIEFTALQTAFAEGTDETGFCRIGTAKTNVGHLDIAAGVTGLIKAALTLKHGVIPPLLHYTAPNPRIDFEHSAFRPVSERTEWPRGETPRIAGVSAFGVGGTNIHMIIEEAPVAPEEAAAPVVPGPRVFPLSASSPEALAQAVADLGASAAANTDADPDRIVATLRHGRRLFAHRTVLVAEDMAGLSASAGAQARPVKAGNREALAFLFPGQGAQHVGMARELYEHAPVFREALKACCDLLEPELGLNLLDIIHAPEEQREEMTGRLKDTSLAQPSIFAVSYALAKQWDHWGITPDVMVGHSIGEFAAATIAGVIDLPDALKLIALRGRLMADLPRGVMVSVRASEDEVLPYLGSGLDLAAVNGAKAVVLAGPEEAADAILPQLEADGFVASRLHTSHAFHSHMMEPALAPFRDAVAKIELRAPRIPILSTVTGDWLTDDEAMDPDYWASHMRKPVRFFDAIQVLWAEGRHMFLESGPGRTLATLAGQNPDRARAQPAIGSLPHAQAENADSHAAMLESFGMLWAHGWPVDWTRIDEGRPEARRMSGLPAYPFQRTRHWVEPVDAKAMPEATIADAEVTAEIPPGGDGASLPPADAGAAIRDMLADLSGIDPAEMDGQSTFLELGFDSLLLTQATREIADRFEVTVTLRELIDGLPNIDALAAHIEANGNLAGAAPADRTPMAEMTRIETPAADEPQAEATPSSAPVTKITREAETLSPAQQAHIDQLVARFTAKTATSKALTEKYRPVHADPRTASGFNRMWKEIVYQIVSAKSKGSRLIDVDGNEYVDLLNGFGPGFLGHNHPAVTSALAEQMAAGYEVGPQHLAAMESAQLFCDLTGNERASFVCTGSEAVYAAMRLARTVTARDRVVMFQRDYHGNFDEVLVRGIEGKDGPRTLPLAPGIPRDAVKNVVVLPYGTAQSLDWIRKNADSLAAVIVEPVQSRRPEFRPAEFIRSVRQITEKSGALFIFDEVVTGFRFGPRGAQAFYNVDADLVTYGKVVGGEMPVGVVSGKARYMDTFDGGQWQYGDDSFPEAPVTFFAGTFVRHPLAMAATRAMLKHLKDQPGHFWTAINAKGDKLAGTIDRWFEDNDIPLQMPNCGSLMYLRIGEDQKYGGLYGAHLRDRGVFLLEGFPSYLTASHDDQDIDYVVSAMQDAALELRSAGLFTGRDAVAYDGPKVTAPPARLSLADGGKAIDAAMTRPLEPIAVPTTEAQREIWTAISITPDLNRAYNECAVVELRGAGIDVDLLADAIGKAVQRHDALTAVMSPDGMEMRIGSTMPTIDVVSLETSGDANAEMAAICDREVGTAFDLTGGPLARFRIVRRGPEAVDMIMTAHHIVFDGWSAATLLRDIRAAYVHDIRGERARLPKIESAYEFSRAEQTWLDSPAGAEARDFWKAQFEDQPTPAMLPPSHVVDGAYAVDAARIDLRIDADRTQRLRKAAGKLGVTLHSLLFAGYKLLTARMTGATDIAIGVPAAGQLSYGLENLVIHGVNMMPVRSTLNPEAGFRDFVKTVAGNTLKASEHQNLTYGGIVRELAMRRVPGKTPLIAMTFNLDPALGADELDFTGTHALFHSVPRQYNNFAISLNMTDRREVIDAEWTYQTALFEADRIESFMDSLLDLLDRAIEAPDEPVASLLSATGPEQMAIEAVAIREGAVDTTPVPAQIAEIAAASPDRVAVTAPETATTLRYDQMDRQANRIAHSLAGRGIGRGDIVAILADRRADIVPALLGVMRSGAAYLPIDPELPGDRIRFMLEDSGARLVVTSGEARASLPDPSPCDALDLEAEEIAASDASAPDVTLSPEDRAYVIYTSGSTGRPKGVEVSHGNLSNLVASFAETPGLAADDRVLAHTSVSFDMSVADFWSPLVLGASMAIVTRDATRDAGRLAALIEEAGVTLMRATPSLYTLLLESGWQGGRALTATIGGESVPQALVDRLLPRVKSVWITYGPTEATVFCTTSRIEPGDRVSIGRPIRNTEIRVLGPGDQPVPLGVPGEIVVGGQGVAMGYLNRPDLTDAAFVTLADRPCGRFYRTGDLGRWIRGRDGNPVLDILGRADGQVKLRGYRIETGEIEAALAALPAIGRAAVVVTGDGAAADLVALVTPAAAGGAIDARQVRADLGRTLPPYMVPARIVALDAMPLLSSGKIDRRRLSDIAATARTGDASGPRQDPETETETRLLEVWQGLLPGVNFGVEDNFFELGGHSLKAVRLFDDIRNRFGLDLPISTLFAHQSVRSLATEIDAMTGTVSAPRMVEIDSDDDWDTTVVMHPGPALGTELPMFIVGGAGGNVNNLYTLAKEVGRTRRVIGFQTRGVMGHRPHETVEAMAEENIRYMRQHQQTGPYLIAGYSGGSNIALEMVRQLEARGERVTRLLLLDVYAPGYHRWVRENIETSALQWAASEWTLLRDRGMSYFRQRLSANLRVKIARGPLMPLMRRFSYSNYRYELMRRVASAAAQNFRGGPVRAPLTLIQCPPSTVLEKLAYEHDVTLGWKDYSISQDITRHSIDGDHQSILEGDQLREMVACFESDLGSDRADAA